MIAACSIPLPDFALILLILVLLGFGAGVVVGLKVANRTFTESRKASADD